MVVSLGGRGAGLSVLLRFGVEAPLFHSERPNMDTATSGCCATGFDEGPTAPIRTSVKQPVIDCWWVAELTRRKGSPKTDKKSLRTRSDDRGVVRDARDRFTFVDRRTLHDPRRRY